MTEKEWESAVRQTAGMSLGRLNATFIHNGDLPLTEHQQLIVFAALYENTKAAMKFVAGLAVAGKDVAGAMDLPTE